MVTSISTCLLCLKKNSLFCKLCYQLKNMIAALYSSRNKGSKKLTLDGVEFGWETIEKIYSQEMTQAEQGLSRNVPGLKFAFVCRDNWTRLNVRPAKIMQVPRLFNCIY